MKTSAPGSTRARIVAGNGMHGAPPWHRGLRRACEWLPLAPWSRHKATQNAVRVLEVIRARSTAMAETDLAMSVHAAYRDSRPQSPLATHRAVVRTQGASAPRSPQVAAATSARQAGVVESSDATTTPHASCPSVNRFQSSVVVPAPLPRVQPSLRRDSARRQLRREPVAA